MAGTVMDFADVLDRYLSGRYPEVTKEQKIVVARILWECADTFAHLLYRKFAYAANRAELFPFAKQEMRIPLWQSRWKDEQAELVSLLEDIGHEYRDLQAHGTRGGATSGEPKRLVRRAVERAFAWKLLSEHDPENCAKFMRQHFAVVDRGVSVTIEQLRSLPWPITKKHRNEWWRLVVSPECRREIEFQRLRRGKTPGRWNISEQGPDLRDYRLIHWHCRKAFDRMIHC